LNWVAQSDIRAEEEIVVRHGNESLMLCFFCHNEKCGPDVLPTKSAVLFVDPNNVNDPIRDLPAKQLPYQMLQFSIQTDRKGFIEVECDDQYSPSGHDEIPQECFDELTLMAKRENLQIPKVGGYPTWVSYEYCEQTEECSGISRECLIQYIPIGANAYTYSTEVFLVISRCPVCGDIEHSCEM
jgi:hypothetical protein